MILTQSVRCPYCGEFFDSSLDVSAGSQEYFEDCYVCCRPIIFFTRVDHAGSLVSVEIRRDDD